MHLVKIFTKNILFLGVIFFLSGCTKIGKVLGIDVPPPNAYMVITNPDLVVPKQNNILKPNTKEADPYRVPPPVVGERALFSAYPQISQTITQAPALSDSHVSSPQETKKIKQEDELSPNVWNTAVIQRSNSASARKEKQKGILRKLFGWL